MRPSLRLLESELVGRIVDEALGVLEKNGVLIEDPDARGRLENFKVVYKETPEQMAAGLPDLLAAGARIVGGCCGSTPDHTRRLRAVLDTGGTAP